MDIILPSHNFGDHVTGFNEGIGFLWITREEERELRLKVALKTFSVKYGMNYYPVVSTYNQILCYTETKVIMISKQAHYVVMCWMGKHSLRLQGLTHRTCWNSQLMFVDQEALGICFSLWPLCKALAHSFLSPVIPLIGTKNDFSTSVCANALLLLYPWFKSVVPHRCCLLDTRNTFLPLLSLEQLLSMSQISCRDGLLISSSQRSHYINFQYFSWYQ